jgi:ABC-type bacteriocin/lantibiotic exporter with double-glycine peptidase domain
VIRRRRGAPTLLAPEVVQTSAMDCGPAALKCLLDGFGVHASYGRLREACQTDVDGTSIDTLEDLANDIGLVAEQILLPVDHVASSARDLLPAIVVVRRPGGLLHFVVAWRRHGPVVQVMDPATGRRWPAAGAFTDEIYSHAMAVPADAWRRWAASDLFSRGLRTRARVCGIRQSAIDGSIADALKDEGWRSMAALDAALRMIATLRASRAFGRGDAERTLTAIWRRTCDAVDPTSIVPIEYWSVTAGEPAGEEEHVRVRGAVLVRIRGLREAPVTAARARPLPREVAAALAERPIEPARHLFNLLRADGVLAPAVLIVALLVATLGVVVEALFFRSLIDVGAHLSLTGQRLAAMGAIAALAGLLLAIEFPIVRAALGFGRRLEVRLRIAFMDTIPRLADRYFRSRPSSDMAERGHAIHQIRELPNMGVQLARAVFELLLTTAGIIVLYPEGRTIAVAAAAASLAVPVLAQSSLRERDLRQRTHTGALARFYLDAFLGLVAVRAHGAERALAREQEGLLVEWASAARAVLRGVVTANAVQLAAGMGLAAALLFARLRTGDEGAGALLLAYWALNIPVLGQQIAQIAWQYPTQRNLALRLIEPLGALDLEEDTRPVTDQIGESLTDRAACIDLRNVTVHAGGHRILEEATLTIPSGAHVAIVGASGAGKSTLVGLLLGWHVPAEGSVTVDGRPLEGAWLDEIRSCTAWVDPAVQLWNQSLAANLSFGNTDVAALGTQIRDADLRRLVEQLPDGLQTPLGEGGALVSGGEGQRVRFGRALGRARARLAILDEPFRGLERETRAALLRHARDRWRDATLLCVTHDIRETMNFARVIVVSHGRIVEDGPPHELASRTDSEYRALLDGAAAVRGRLLTTMTWRRMRMVDGALVAARHASDEPPHDVIAKDTGSMTPIRESV